MISIVIPTFNEEHSIKASLEQFAPYKKKYSIQTIVADARSTDKTVQVARKIADKVVVEEQRGTIAKGRNFGAAQAKGEIIVELDADSRIADPDQFFTRILDVFKDPKVVAATPRLQIYPEEQIFRDRFFHMLINGSIRFANHFGSFIAKGECQIMRRSAFEKAGGYNEGVVFGEDCELYVRLAKMGKIVVFRDVTVYHSPRRFRQMGYFRVVIWLAIKEGFSLFVRGKSYMKAWKPVR